MPLLKTDQGFEKSGTAKEGGWMIFFQRTRGPRLGVKQFSCVPKAGNAGRENFG